MYPIMNRTQVGQGGIGPYAGPQQNRTQVGQGGIGPYAGPQQTGGPGMDFIRQMLSKGVSPQQLLSMGVSPQQLQALMAQLGQQGTQAPRLAPQVTPIGVNPYQVANNAPLTSGAYSGYQPRPGPLPVETTQRLPSAWTTRPAPSMGGAYGPGGPGVSGLSYQGVIPPQTETPMPLGRYNEPMGWGGSAGGGQGQAGQSPSGQSPYYTQRNSGMGNYPGLLR